MKAALPSLLALIFLLPALAQGQGGLILTVAPTPVRGEACHRQDPKRSYEIASLKLEITLNRFLDYDPSGYMYALQADVPRVRQEEQQNKMARFHMAQPALSLGLQGDAIQPLVLRVNPGECLRVELLNKIAGEPSSFVLYGIRTYLPDGSIALSSNRKTLVQPGKTQIYEWRVSESEPEGTHYFHSDGNPRVQTSHGLFGAVIVEPKGSKWLEPRTLKPLSTGWQAIIQPVAGPAFREAVLFYHEIGSEAFRILNAQGREVPQVDPYTGSYKPAGRAINYRSEPFMDRLALQQAKFKHFDKSLAYSSYAFGDPATPILRSYLGDPFKERIVHGGTEVYHIHHVHGGGIRWKKQPGVADTHFASGLNKHPELTTQSERVDSQALGPSESFDIEHECGSGGCQGAVGDFLVHCHVAQHYLSGMWGIWRVYNTLQTGGNWQDGLGPLMELPDRKNQIQAAVAAKDLVGKKVPWRGGVKEITAENLLEFIQAHLPPAGNPQGYQAAVWDWDNAHFLAEPESADTWEDFKSQTPNQRPPLLFDPKTGQPAYPFLRPHLGKRPPFAPGHGPAAYLDPYGPNEQPPAPGNGICPTGTKLRHLEIEARPFTLTIEPARKLVDPEGTLYAIKGSNTPPEPLAFRANAAEDCIDLLFSSALSDAQSNYFFSKASLHIHFVQFDVQGSDGVTAGLNYEQTLRPYAKEGLSLAQFAPTGSNQIGFSSPPNFPINSLIAIGLERPNPEIRRVVKVEGNTLTLNKPLGSDQPSGAKVSSEFLRMRWYADTQFGTAYFHDHVDGLNAWKHGLFGALIAEPPGSSYHNPQTGEPIQSGLTADIHTQAPVYAGLQGSFREQVLFIQDDNPITQKFSATGGSYNLRVSPLLNGKFEGLPPVQLQAYPGDPVVFRTLVSGTNEVHSLHLEGHDFPLEPYSPTSPRSNTVSLGISERYDLPTVAARPGTYHFFSGQAAHLKEGLWGQLEVLAPGSGNLQPLPGRTAPALGPVCPTEAPLKRFSVVAQEASLPMLGKAKGRVYALEGQAAKAEPLVLYAGLGDCLEITLKNTTQIPAGFLPDRLTYDPEKLAPVPPKGQFTYRFFVRPEMGEGAILIRDFADLFSAHSGLFGAIVTVPAGAQISDPTNGKAVQAGWRADVWPKTGKPYRSLTLFLQDDDPEYGTKIMPYRDEVQGITAINYAKGGPLLEAISGDDVHLHLLLPYSEQGQVFGLEGHRWPFEARVGSNILSSISLGGLSALMLNFTAGPAGDYRYADARLAYNQAGLRGLFRVDRSQDISLEPLYSSPVVADELSQITAASWCGKALPQVAQTLEEPNQ